MKLQTPLPDLAASFARIKTMLELEAKVETETIFGHAIKLAFIEKQPNSEIITMIKDQLQDNRKAVETCIPEYIIRSIEKYWPEITPSDNLKNVLDGIPDIDKNIID